MRYLGIDYGTKKVGIALSDEEASFAFPYTILKNDPTLFETLRGICEKEGVGMIVLGYSLTQSGKENDVVEQTTYFVEKIKKEFTIPVFMQNELFSSVEAHRYQIKKGDRDDSAAAIILQRFLDSQK
jgi:putative holliday junction resolvase